MRRRYSIARFHDRVERVLKFMPEAALGTDLIAGFPGETSYDFESYFNFVAHLPLAYFHVFPYSRRTGTTAAKMSAQVEAHEIKTRAARLRELDRIKRREFASRFSGTRKLVLLEESFKGGLRGYTRNYLRVLTSGSPDLINQEVEVDISLAEGAELVGQMVTTDNLVRGSHPVHSV
jgi:threonylcarbamoyladenosine tRNA methylthiotransferase MtaB